MSSVKDTVAKAAHNVVDKAADAVQAVATGANQVALFVKEKVGIEGPDREVVAIAERWT